jgi:hypothetical protein
MTVKTPAHVHLHYLSGDPHAAHIAMAVFTIGARRQVSLMAEVDEIRLFTYSDPWDWLAALPISGKDLDGTIVRRDRVMAAHAFLHGRYTSDIRAQRAGVAEQTLHTGLHVSLVLVCDGLTRGGQDLSAREENPPCNSDHDK